MSTNEPSNIRVLVLGAHGALGTLVADAFRRSGWDVHPAGRRPDDDPCFRRIDVADPAGVRAGVEGIDVVVTTVPDPALEVERHVLERGGLLLNLAAGPAPGLRALRAERREPQGTVVMNAGVAPGVTNLVAAALLTEHPEADEVEMVFTVTTRGSGGRASADFAHRGLTGVGHHRTVTVRLPQPFGRRRVLGFAETDRGWLGEIADGLTVNPYLCLAERPAAAAMNLLNSTRLIGRLPRSALGSGRPSTGASGSHEPVAHSVAVRRRGRRLGARLVRGRGDFRMAAASAVVFAEALRARLLESALRPGAWGPEDLLTLDVVTPGLRRAGIEVSEPVD